MKASSIGPLVHTCCFSLTINPANFKTNFSLTEDMSHQSCTCLGTIVLKLPCSKVLQYYEIIVTVPVNSKNKLVFQYLGTDATIMNYLSI